MSDRLTRPKRAADQIRRPGHRVPSSGPVGLPPRAVERIRGFTERVTAQGRAETLSVNERLWVDRLRRPDAR
ncbi:hypothetical protein C7C45_17760 [Micromonospora arborensis]|uniref:Uncharacterized protein n=1 Tax=Micromonospora arborensis TaxID=2116518 RepID=A0A318P0T7_9ACTN|nr:hypothetical protein C7C45_17760 [Micromonospora arborensis]